MVERIIGKRDMSNNGINFVEYLIKWEGTFSYFRIIINSTYRTLDLGYPASEADWRTGDDMGSTFRVLCSDFERQAVVEGALVMSTSTQSDQSKILLKEATDAGWT